MNCALKVCQCFDVMVETHYETRIVSIMRVLYTCFVCVLQAKPFFYALLQSVSQILLIKSNHAVRCGLKGAFTRQPIPRVEANKTRF